jgi:Spy/CpxP family protein refolding chaperone
MRVRWRASCIVVSWWGACVPGPSILSEEPNLMSTKPKSTDGGSNWPKVIALSVIVIAASAIAWSTWSRYSGGLPEAEEVRPGRPDPAEMRERMTQAIAQADLTEEQTERLSAVMDQGPPRNRDDMQARRAEMAEILTPEQMQAFETQMRQGMQQRMQQRMQEARERLSDEDFQAFQERIAERMNNRPGGPGGPPQ